MTWKSLPNRGETLRAVIATADARRDGLVPMDVPGVAEAFGDELTLVGALQLRWISRLNGRIERELAEEPLDLEGAVVRAWAGLAAEMPGVRAIIDHYRAEPTGEAMARAMLVSTAKEQAMLAVLAGRSSGYDARAARVGHDIEQRARASYDARRRDDATADRSDHKHALDPFGFLDRIRAAIAA